MNTTALLNTSPIDGAELKPAIDIRAFRRALGEFTTGVTIVATRETNGTPRGLTASSFTSVSLNPPLILVCIGNSAASCSVLCRAARFSVNILAAHQHDVASLFATQRSDKFAVTPWKPGTAGVPLIKDSLAWFECERYDTITAGDHVILVGRVANLGQAKGTPLAYMRGAFCSVNPAGALAANSDGTNGEASQGTDLHTRPHGLTENGRTMRSGTMKAES